MRRWKVDSEDETVTTGHALALTHVTAPVTGRFLPTVSLIALKLAAGALMLVGNFLLIFRLTACRFESGTGHLIESKNRLFRLAHHDSLIRLPDRPPRHTWPRAAHRVAADV